MTRARHVQMPHRYRSAKGFRRIVVVAFLSSIVAVSTAHAQRIELFGGARLDVYLGCFSCFEGQPDSLFNPYGRYGSEYQPDSIFNDFGLYGSRFSAYSVCNKFATNPPVLVDATGRRYGFLTLNRFKYQAVTDPDVLRWLEFTVCTD